MKRYSIKMRASRETAHISGAEKIIREQELETYCAKLLKRAMEHSKGKPDTINLKMEEIDEQEILFLKALPVTVIKTNCKEEGMEAVRRCLEQLNLVHIDEILAIWKESYAMRGAILLDADTLQRLEPDKERGVRATYMDMDTEDRQLQNACAGKNHFNEALVLATKVVNHPNIVAELCISDDPDYVTGYVASRELGYTRITTLKDLGSPNGGRVFLFRGNHQEELQNCIHYLQKQKVLVQDVAGSYDKRSSTSWHKEQSEPIPAQEADKAMKQIDKRLPDKWEFMEQALRERKQQELYRTMEIMEGPQTAYVTCRGKQLLMLASNAYLDLCNEPCIKEYAAQMLDKYGTGSGGSRLTTGTTDIHMSLEKALARFKNREAALVFNTGFAANAGIIPAVCRAEHVIFSDELNHASIIDGCRQSKARTIIYKHNDMQDLEQKIRDSGCRQGLIVSDAVFSMHGDIVDLPGLIRLAKQYNLLSMIDEAHATGVIGTTGTGVEEHYHMEGKVDILMGTLSKAIGAEGGYVCGSELLISYLRNTARSFIFSTSLSPVSMAAAERALKLLEEEPQRVKKLQENTAWFCRCLIKQGIEARSQSAIVPIPVGDEGRALQVSKRLFEEGYFISAIRYPTVKKGEAMLRAAIMATHTKAELEAAAEAIGRAIKEKNV